MDRRPHLLLDAFVHDDVRVGGDGERQHHSGDAGQGQRDRDQLDQREQQDRVEEERQRGHHAEHAVEDEQEEDRQGQARRARQEALVKRLLSERRRDLRLRDQLELDRQRADAQVLRQVLRLLDRADAVDLRARAAVDPLRVLDEVDRRQRDDPVVERDREALERLLLRCPGRKQDPRSALGLALGGARERLAPVVREVHRDDGLVGALVEVLLGVLDVGAGEPESSSITK